MKSELSLYEITQVLGISVLDKKPLYEILTDFSKNEETNEI